MFKEAAFEPFELTYFDEVWWDSSIQEVTFFDKSCSIFQDKLDEKVNKEIGGIKTKKQKVIVEMMDIAWIYSDGNTFNQLIPSLSDIIQRQLSFGDTAFMNALLKTFWGIQQK